MLNPIKYRRNSENEVCDLWSAYTRTYIQRTLLIGFGFGTLSCRAVPGATFGIICESSTNISREKRKIEKYPSTKTILRIALRRRSKSIPTGPYIRRNTVARTAVPPVWTDRQNKTLAHYGF
jgi:hypothetical protein